MIKSDNNLNKLLNNSFIFIKNSDKIKIDSVIYMNNFILINANLISLYLIRKNFTYNEFLYNKYKKEIKRHYITSYDGSRLCLPIGLKQDFIKLVNQDFKYLDIRKKRKFKFTDEEIKNCLGYLQLRDYQISAVKEMFKNNGIIKIITGGGKTVTFLSYIKLTNLKTLILVYSIDIADQIYKEAKKANLDIGFVQGDNIDENHKIVICTISSSHKLQNQYECVVVDECHQISDIYNKVLQNTMFIYRFGFSSTPFTNDKIKNIIIKKFIGDIIYQIDSEILQNDKKIAIPYIYFNNINNEIYKDVKDWGLLEKMCIINNRSRNNKIVDICKNNKDQTIVLIKKIEHGEIIKNLLQENNIKSIFLHGSVKKEEIKNVLKEFELNKNEYVLIGSKILFTGINIQNIYNLIYGSGGCSNLEVLQALGRGLRNNTKSTVNIFDFYDNDNNILIRHSENRLKHYKKEGFNHITIL